MFFFFFPGVLYAMALSFMSMVWSGIRPAATSLAIQENQKILFNALKKKLDPTQKNGTQMFKFLIQKTRIAAPKPLIMATVFQGRGAIITPKIWK